MISPEAALASLGTFLTFRSDLSGPGKVVCVEFAPHRCAVQDKLLKGGLGGATRSDPMARLAGIALGAQGAHVLLAGRADRVTQRRSAKITAAASAVVSGCALTALGSAPLGISLPIAPRFLHATSPRPPGSE